MLSFFDFFFFLFRLYKEATNPPKKSQGQEKTEKGSSSSSQSEEDKKKKQRVDVDIVFFRRLGGILKIAIPGFSSKEFSLLLLHSAFLIIRTWLSVVVANLDGLLVKTLVRFFFLLSSFHLN